MGIAHLFLTLDIQQCQKCNLCERRLDDTATEPRCVVWGRGSGANGVFILGEAPGSMEERYGIPFIGNSGKMLERMLESINLKSQDCYISNIVKCRPEGNAAPAKEHQYACYWYLYHQIKAINPKVILAMGNTPMRFLLRDSSLGITNERGLVRRVYLQNPDYIGSRKKLDTETRFDVSETYPVLPTYHPAKLLRGAKMQEGSAKWEAWQDMIALSNLLLQR